MKLELLASKPQLVKVEVADPATVEKYGEPLEFYMYDRQDMDTFMSLAAMDGTKTIAEMAKLVQPLVLDETGKPVLSDGKMLPADLMIKIVTEAVKNLGNFQTQTIKTSTE